MKTKIFYLLLLCLMVLGRGEVWADEVTFTSTSSDGYRSDDATKNVIRLNDVITITLFSSSSPSYDGIASTQSGGELKFQSFSGFIVSTSYSSIHITGIEVVTGDSGNSFTSNDITLSQKSASDPDNKTWLWSNSGSTLGTITLTNNNYVAKEDGTTFDRGRNLNVTSIIVTYTDSRASLSPAFDWNNMEIHNAGGDQHTYVCSSRFVYDSSKDRMKVRLTVTPRYEGIYGTISSTDETVLKTTTSTLSGPTATTVGGQDAWEIYIDNIQVLKTGSATLRFWFNGNESYKPATLEIPITVIDHSVTPFNNSYRYTWDFAGGDWTSTIAQLGYGNGSGGYNWTKTIVEGTTSEARPTYKEHSTIPAQNGLDIIEGLKFELPIDEGTGYANPNDLCLDWYAGRKAVWLNTNVKVTISNLVKDQTITITADNDNYTIDAGSATKSGSVITVTGAGNVTLKMAQATRISSIAVSNSQYGWSYTTESRLLYNDKASSSARPVKGTFTFTEEGPLTGGTVIKEVPGIELTIGAKGEDWSVVYGWGEGQLNPDFYKDASHYWNIGYVSFLDNKPDNASNPTSGCFYNFYAITNGQLMINYYTQSGFNVYEDHNSDLYANNSEQRIQTKTFVVKAGKTYTLTASSNGTNRGVIWLHSFTFEPKFFIPGTSTFQLSDDAMLVERDEDGNITAEQLETLEESAFSANMNIGKGDFPKLIDPSSETQQNKVKFAGDKTKVYLYKNNDVDLLAAGDNILIRGTVLDKNNEDGLVAYYYLNSQIITLKSAELEDQAYISSGGLTDGKYTFTYHGNIVASGGTLTVKVKKDTEEEGNVTATVNSYDNSNDETTIDIPFASLEKGATYRVRIPTNTLQLNGSPTVKNSEVVRTFSVNKDGEAQVKMIYPTGIATVGTAIILETYINGTAKNVNDGHKVKGILSDGSSNLNLDATFSSSQIVFKPETTLKPNTTYTLTIPTEFGTEPNIVDNKIYLSTKYTTSPEDVYYQVTHNKVFTFTTGSSSGTEPQVIPNGTYPAERAVVPNGEYYGGTISFTFDQKVELEPYSTVTATPVNGSESTATGKTGAPNTVGTLTVGEDGKTVSFNYSEDELKYDLYYQVVIPANTVVGAGGLPNPSPITLNFKMGKNTSSLVSSKVFQGYGSGPIYHPYTWNFTNIGTAGSTTLTDLATATEGENYKTSRWKNNGSSYGNFVTDQADKTPKFPQGDVLSYYIDSQNKEIKEASGLRWSLTKDFSSGLNRVQIPESGTSLHIVGNTHYLTIPDVPAGAKLYIKASKTDLLNVNSPNATFIQGAASDDETKTIGAKTSSSKVYILNCTGGDVSFCLDDVYFEKIAVVTEEKTITEVGYATNARKYAVDYTLNQDFLNKELKAYKVTGVSGSNAVATQVQYVPAYGGVMLKATGDSYPMFAWDCNRVTSDMTENRLVGVVDGQSAAVLPQKSGDKYNYILSTGGVNVKYNYEGSIEEIEDKTGTFGGYVSGLAFYLVMKEGTILENGTAYAYEKPKSNSAYLQLDSYLARQTGTGTESGARQYFPIDFGDESTSVTGIEDESRLSTADDSWISLQGVRVENPGKGLYIHKGKKIVIK